MSILGAAMGTEQHMRPRSQRKALLSCRSGNHRYGTATAVGGGMTRRACDVCSAITIDLSQAYQPAESRLFASVRGTHARESAN